MPNGRAVFGSATVIVPTGNWQGGCSAPSNIKLSHVIYITKTHLKSLDQPNLRCNQEHVNINTSACIASFIEKQLECNSNILGSQYSKSSQCTTKSQLDRLANNARILEQWHILS